MEIYEGKRRQSTKCSRSPSPEDAGAAAPSCPAESFRSVPRPPPSPPVPTNPVAPVAPEPPGPVKLVPCAVCGRTFVPQSLSKHVKICEKMAAKRRKTFDSSRQRREGTDLEQFLPKNFGLPENSPFLEKSPPNTAKVAPKPKPQDKDKTTHRTVMKPAADLQKCPHCNRAFGMRAFERHVEWCADKAKILPAAPAQPPAHLADAKQRLNARTRYKAPLARRKSSQTREKSSNSRSASVESTRGASPPPPPREYGDCRNRRNRASESMSSNDCHDDAPPHVPVIRNSRTSQSNSSGDANVKARQARLAKDLSSSRIDDTYDPFVSAARQMKELLSSDTSFPKKPNSLNSSKDHSRTLPILRPAKDKAPLSQLRTENSKMIKDTLNKTYQKTPTLQRMKSFGSTNNDNSTSLFGGRCSSFRINRNDKKPSPKLNTTFTKSSKENISMADKTNISFNRNNNLNRSFSSYTASSYSTPKLKDKIPKIATSMYHSFQRTTISQPIKLDKIKTDDEKKNFVNLDSILVDDNSSMTDSNYIDPRLINENDNLPINVNTILNNPDIISSMESLLTTENLPSKFDSFSKIQNQNCELNGNIESQSKSETDKINNNNDTNKLFATIPIENLDIQYEKIMSSLEESIASKKIARDEATVFGEFDLEEFMTTFDEEIHKRKSENKRTCSSTTRVVRPAELASNRTSAFSSVCSTPKSINPSSNALTPITNSKSFNFSSNNIVSESIFPSSIKRSNSILDSIQKKNANPDSGKSRHKSDQHELDRDLMQSLNDFDKFYESEKNEITQNRDHNNYSTHNGLVKKDSRTKTQRRSGKSESSTNGNFTPNGKSSNDSAYSSLNRISPSKLSVMAKEPALELPPSDSSSHKDERSGDSDEFLAMERSAELEARAREADQIHDARVSSRASSRRGARRGSSLSSSGSEASLARFCHACGARFPLHSAKFCVDCGVRRLVL